MYVSSEVRRRELPEASPDSMPYASAAAGTSFMAILTEVSKRPTDTSAGQAPDEGAETTDVSKVSELPDQESDASEESVDTRSATRAEEGQESDAAESTRTTATEPPTETEGGDAPATANTVIVAPLPSGTVVSPDVAGIEESPSQVDTAVELTAEGQGAMELVDMALADADADASDVVKPVTTVPLDAAETAAVAESDAEVVSASPIETFPKTMNAIIAEGAIRQGTDKSAETDPLKVDTQDVVDATVEPGAEPPLPDVPDTPPLPQAAALESGGVRPQSSGLPRLPMANLPGELAQQIHLMQQEGTRTMRLTLVPENLGELQIEIQGTGDTMRVRLISANPAVRDALESQMGSLKDALQKQGLALDNATVDSGTTRRDATPEQDRRPATPYRETALSRETAVAGIRASAPLALGSSALNILA